MRVSELSVGLLAYFVGADHLYVLLLDQGGAVERFRLASCHDAVPQIDLLLNVLTSPTAWPPSRRATVVRSFSLDWGRRLLPPADRLRVFDILIIVPHDILHGVPLHLVQLDDKQALGVTHGITYCSSCTLLTRCVERNLARNFDPCSWTFPLADDAVPPAGPPVRTCLGYGVDVLTGKDAEYQKVARAFASHFPVSAIATCRHEMKSALDRSRRIATAENAWVHPDAICLVCHGYYDATTLDRSGLLLAGRRGVVNLHSIRVHGDTMLRVQDHPLAETPLHLETVRPNSAPLGIFDPELMTVGELRVQCETDAQLVALFGCSTGSGEVTSSDDYVSLAYQWLKTGAASVLANFWEADFPILTEWAERFAVHWTRLRQPKAIAAREATRTLLAERPELKEQPALWGSLSVLGDWL